MNDVKNNTAATAEKGAKPLGVAFIGNGKSANRYHMPFIFTRPDKFQVKAVWEHHPGESPWEYKEDIDYTGDLDAMLARPDIDLVVVSTPVRHHELVTKALLADKNVICEKPFTETPEEAADLFRLAEERGLFLSAYQNRRFDSDFLTVKAVVESGKLGEVYEIEEHYDYWRSEVSRDTVPSSPSKSMIYEHGVHTVDQAVGWLGAPDDVVMDVRQLHGPGRFNDYFDIDLRYAPGHLPFASEAGLKYSVQSSYLRARPRPSFEVYGTRGHFVKEREDRQEEHLKLFHMPDNADFGLDRPEDWGTLVWYDDEGDYHEEKVPTVRGDYARFYDGVYATLVDGAEPVVKPEETLAVMDILSEGVGKLQ